MPRRVDARDVLDPNAQTKIAFAARVVGHFRPTGPNRWDDYHFVEEPGETLEVLPGLPIQVEAHGVEFRMRAGGRVLRASWNPPDDVARALGGDAHGLRRRFLAECIDGFAEARGQGAGAMIVRKLKE
jgi:hypothetical protein